MDWRACIEAWQALSRLLLKLYLYFGFAAQEIFPFTFAAYK
jgi:hypothetical protein